MAVLSILFARHVIQDFKGPVMGPYDFHQWSYAGYFFSENFSLLPWPQLDLHTNRSFYPYGTNQVFRSWGLEQNLFGAGLFHLFGPGPWVQVHYLASVVVTAAGCYLLLAKEHGRFLAAYVAVIAAFGNFYAIGKFPEHANIATVHWTTLNVVADYVLARRYFQGKPWTASLLLGRFVLLVLALGQDLGYVAGFALTSFVLTFGFIGLCDWCRWPALWPWTMARLGGWLAHLRATADGRRKRLFALGAVGIAASTLYIPLVLQIRHEALSFDFGAEVGWELYVSPVRLVIPILWDLPSTRCASILGDIPETRFEGSPGLFLVIPALLSLTWRRGSRAPLVPILALLAICLASHPKVFSMLKVFPWFHFARVGGRTSLIYPVALALISLPLWQAILEKPKRRFVFAAFCLLMLAESVSAYRLLIQPKPYFTPDERFYLLMSEIRGSPGEALLEWPFCIAGGNAVGVAELGRFYGRHRGNFALRQFHDKKVVGDYFGRLHASQLRPFLDAGWPKMFFPDQEDYHRAQRQTRDFNPAEWEFFEQFFVLNDFCGILAYADSLPRETLDGLEQRFGKPAVEAVVPDAGRALFYPKSSALRALQNPAKGRRVSLTSAGGVLPAR